MSRISNFLWFNDKAEEAAEFYTSLVEDSRITDVTRNPDGSAMVVGFELDGQRYNALNGGPHFTFNEAFSIQISCETQEQVDQLWDTLTDGGEEGPCGWLKDRYGLSWQVIPTALPKLLGDPDPERAARAGAAMRTMKKIDIKALVDAVEQS